MKEGQHQRKKLTAVTMRHVKAAAYLILLLLAYTFGYFSSPPRPTSSSSSSVPTPTGFDRTINSPSQLNNFRVTTHCSVPVPSELVRQTIFDRVFNGTSPFHNFPPLHAANLLRSQRIKGWGSNGAVFNHLIQKVKPRTIIEVGSFLGASAIHMVELTRQLGLNTNILCVDDFRGWPGFRDRFKDLPMNNGDVLLLYQFMQNVVSMNTSDSIIPLPFSSGSVLDSFCEWGIYGDLIEVDAGHDFNSAWSDIIRAYRILRPGGVLFGHDYFLAVDNKGVRRAVNLFAKMNGLKVKVDGQHWVIDSA